ncbi:hypothetical protein [Vineibacter terrae]|uniref:hypothetical protein n=1 Tax=Vineibacter terrae TaxID=2586908 RepID=UPI002E305263|nr:hypothetical protein [Vineibacter terrae]HEX2888058.1 hypothetical protein [Vineibacter terrae]
MSRLSGKQWVMVAALAGAALGAGEAVARDFYDLPPGPYRQECRNERVEGGYLLRATCPKRDGALRESSLDLRTCPRGAIVYNDGAYLKCNSSGGGSNTGYGKDRYGYSLPPGPYRYDCRNERVEGGYLLRATCPKHDGALRESSLDLRTCPRGTPVYNDGAYLKCGTPPGNSDGWRDREARGRYDLPGGPYRRECRNERVINGYLLMATCPKNDGQMRDASIDLRTCPRGSLIYNEGAYLRCR